MSAIQVNGFTYTHEQVEAAINAAWQFCLAYEVANPAAGGGGTVEWEDLNLAHEEARKVFDLEALQELRGEAAALNSIGDPDEVDESGFGFVETEGGSHD